MRPGDALTAIAQSAPNGSALAIALATIAGGAGSGAFRAVVDPQLAGALPSGEVAVGAAVDPQGRRAMFVENHVILRETKPGALQSFIERRRGRLLNTLRIAARNARGAPRTDVPPAIFHVLSVDPGSVDPSNFEVLVERFAQLQGTWRYSSENSLRLAALVAEEVAAGNMVFTNDVGQYDAIPASNEGVNDAFQQNWLNPMTAMPPATRAGQAMAMAEILLKPFPPKDTPKIKTALIDGGFANPADWSAPGPPPAMDYGMPFGSIPQCSINIVGSVTCGGGTAAGSNPLSCADGAPCPWHGTGSFSAAGGKLNNGYGAGALGSRVVSPIFIKLPSPPTMIAQAAAVDQSVSQGAQVINISMGTDCIQIGLNWCNPSVYVVLGGICAAVSWSPVGILSCAAISVLVAMVENESALDAAITSADGPGSPGSGTVVVASAGNDGKDVGEVHRVPCALDRVICVGALEGGSSAPFIKRLEKSNFGDLVNVWGPGALVSISPRPSDPLPTLGFPALPTSSGTSIAAPFVAGSVAVARALAPKLSSMQLRDVLAGSNCRSGGTARVAGVPCAVTGDALIDKTGYLDGLELVRLARAKAGRPSLGLCTGGFDADEAGTANDKWTTAVPMTPLSTATPLIASKYPVTGNGDLSIHALLNPAGVDQDWYGVTITPRCPATAWLTEVVVSLADPSLGVLLVEVYQESADPLVAPVEMPSELRCSPWTGGTTFCSNEITKWVVLRSDTRYFVKVLPRSVDNTNCYSNVSARLIRRRTPPRDNPSCP